MMISVLRIPPSVTGKNNRMSENEKYTGFAIALAWPQTFCKQPGSWYDPLALRLGLNMNHYYRVGHAAVVLIDRKNNKSHYFDFGRYHTPFQHGRVRSVDTDHELSIKTIPAISPDNTAILNYLEILSELQNNKACHGEGNLHASYCPVNFQAAFDKATHMQKESPIPYGPFRITGSNCSRFVNTVIRAGKPNWKFGFRLKYGMWFTPTPMNNVNSLKHRKEIPAQLNTIPFFPTRKLDNNSLKSTLKPPIRQPNIPKNAQWLGGEGAGSWFVFDLKFSHIKVTRFSPDGVTECSGYYKNKYGQVVLPDNRYRITYPSNCQVISLTSNRQYLQFDRVSDFHPITQKMDIGNSVPVFN